MREIEENNIVKDFIVNIKPNQGKTYWGDCIQLYLGSGTSITLLANVDNIKNYRPGDSIEYEIKNGVLATGIHPGIPKYMKNKSLEKRAYNKK